MSKKKGSGTANSGNDKKDDEYDIVYEYLKRVNRPYSANDIYNNLQGKYSKSVITKTLDILIEHSLVQSKTYGKSVIYSVKQDLDSSLIDDCLKTVDSNLESLTKEYEDIQAQTKRLEQEMATIKSQPSSEEAKKALDSYLEENKKLEGRLKKLRSERVIIAPEKRKRVEEEYEYSRKMWKKRKSMFKEIFQAVTEHIPGDPKQLRQELGIEEDSIPYDKAVV